ncbi:MAG: diguanylate cyclase [Desulfovibrionaceae bacterium]|nr:diguanylate cyclase [Desulfovibrionaceae bacterium]
MAENEKNSILIIDDDRASLKALTLMLSPDYEIYTAKDGLDAIETAVKFLPDLILLDIVMPDMNGYEVIAELKKHEKVKDIPVIFITALGNAEDEEKGLAMNAVDYISKPFSSKIVKLRVSNQIKMLNQLQTIERLSVTDQVTGIANRRCFDNFLKTEWNRAIREQLPISLLIIDIDHFKRYNDTYGHQQGDVALQAVAKAIAENNKRAGDLTARLGGEEFAVVLPNAKLEGGLGVAEQIRSGVENLVIPCADGSITKITVSIGVSSLLPTQGSSMDAFISQTDNMLYTAKETGRNRVCAI